VAGLHQAWWPSSLSLPCIASLHHWVPFALDAPSPVSCLPFVFHTGTSCAPSVPAPKIPGLVGDLAASCITSTFLLSYSLFFLQLFFFLWLSGLNIGLTFVRQVLFPLEPLTSPHFLNFVLTNVTKMVTETNKHFFLSGGGSPTKTPW
jgi:hypothetical protein